MKDIKRTLERATDIVLSAGQIVRDRLGSDFMTNCKSCAADLVTEVDRHSQSIIVEGLNKAFPDHRLVAEEDFGEEELVLDHRPVWFIDPLDGTTNFVFGIPLCTVTVALTVGGKPVLGVTCDPFRGEIFTAARGNGAYLNQKAIRVDQARKTLPESLLTTGFPTSDQFKKEMLKADFEKIFFKAADVRALGSAALELAYVACGRLTGYWEVTLRPWDVAAGILLVEEAGGRVSDPCGKELALNNYVSIVATNGHIHDELVKDLGFANIRGKK